MGCQFAHILVPGKVLRRPISICDADKSCLRLVYQVKGEGTEILSKVKVGEELDIIAPLGNGFDIKPEKRYCFIGGGIGVPPMLYASKQKEKPIVITGFRNKDLVILQSDFRKDNCELYLTTDDGSAGEKAFVTDVLKRKLDEIDVTKIMYIAKLALKKEWVVALVLVWFVLVKLRETVQTTMFMYVKTVRYLIARRLYFNGRFISKGCRC